MFLYKKIPVKLMVNSTCWKLFRCERGSGSIVQWQHSPFSSPGHTPGLSLASCKDQSSTYNSMKNNLILSNDKLILLERWYQHLTAHSSAQTFLQSYSNSPSITGTNRSSVQCDKLTVAFVLSSYHFDSL